MAQGRPSSYNDEIADKICVRLSEGESVRSIAQDPNMPAMSTIFKWKVDNKIFSEQYDEARRCQAEKLFDELINIADTGEDVQRDRLRVDTRKWFLSKVAPKVYGEKLDLTSDGDKIEASKIIITSQGENPDVEVYE